jgi:hypothetical protein
MIRKYIWLGCLTLVGFSLGAARAQMEPGAPLVPGPSPALLNASVPLNSTPKPAPGLSQWIVGTDPDCCGPLSDRTPLQTELFIRSGFSFILGDGQLHDSLDDGWAIEGGGRALLFNERDDAAWSLELGLLNIHNLSDNAPPVTLLNFLVRSQQGRVIVPEQQVHVTALNRTVLTLGGGREWYLFGSARGTRDGEGARWRIGADAGGRYGTAKVEFAEIRHFTDVIAGAYVAVHSDVDIPCGCCTFYGGLRIEYDRTWSDILQIQNKSDLDGINLLLTFGVRY